MDFASAQRTLQSAIDQYPKLVALNFNLSSDTDELEASHSRFQTALRPLFEALINDRIDAGKTTPPTQLRYLWLPVQPVLNGVLLINQNSIWQTSKDGELSDAINTVFHCLYQAGKTATGNECVRQLDTSYLQLDRTDTESFQHSYRLLQQLISQVVV